MFVPLVVCSVKGFIFVNDTFSVLFVALLGFTNGYLGSLCILLVNDCCDVEERGAAGMLTGLALNLGLVLGSIAALFFQSPGVPT